MVERDARLSPEEAALVWRGVVEGRFAVVALREADGRRVLTVREAPGAGLSAREQAAVALAAAGRSNKEIGFQLGIAPSTAAGVLAAAAAKVGLRTRRELIALFGSSAAGGDRGRGRPG